MLCAIFAPYQFYCGFNWFIIMNVIFVFAHVINLSICKIMTLIFLFQDKELRYRFIYNHFPSLQEEVMIAVEALVARLYD